MDRSLRRAYRRAPMRIALIWLGLTACAPVRPEAGRLAGPVPMDPNTRQLARWLELARADLGDLLVLEAAPGREAVLPDPTPTGQVEATLRIERLERAFADFDERALPPSFAEELRHARALLARARFLWVGPPRALSTGLEAEAPRKSREEEAPELDPDAALQGAVPAEPTPSGAALEGAPPELDGRGGPQVLRARWLDLGLTRGRRSVHGAPDDERRLALDRLARFARRAAEVVRVAGETERAWALYRLDLHAQALAPSASREADRGRAETLAVALGAYRSALAGAPDVAPPSLQASLQAACGATTAPDPSVLRAEASRAFEEARRRLYALSVQVVENGPTTVNERIEAAIALARGGTEDAAVGLSADALERATLRLERWLDEARAWPGEPVELIAEPGEVVELFARRRAVKTDPGAPGSTAEPPEGGRVDGASLEGVMGAGPRAQAIVALEDLALYSDDALLVLLARAFSPLIARATRPAERAFPLDDVAVEAMATQTMAALAEARAESPRARLLALTFVTERRARALAELTLFTEGEAPAREQLVALAWHSPSLAEEVVRAARTFPGAFSAPFCREWAWEVGWKESSERDAFERDAREGI